MNAIRSILLIAAILFTLLANAQHILTLQCMQMGIIVTSPSCSGFCDGYLDLSVSGGQSPYTYLWNTTDTTQDLFNICAGVYNVTVTDASGCTVDSSYTVIDPVAIGVIATGTDVSCFGSCDGSFDPDNFGGPWENYILNYPVDLSALCSGEYDDVLTAYDQNGCPFVFTVTINSPEPLEGDVYTTPASCSSACDGSIELDVYGGTPPYNFQNYTDLCEGLYSIFVTDANGCQFQRDVFIYSIAGGPSIINIVPTDVFNGQSNGSIVVTATGFYPPFVYSLNNGPYQASNIFTGLPHGNYLISVKDSLGCIDESEVSINNITTAVNELLAIYKIYPNPASFYLYANADVPISIDILDLQGHTIRNDRKSFSHQIPLEGIVPGLYVLRISDGSGVAYRRVIVE